MSSRDNDVRIHQFIRALLDQPAAERQRWLAEALPDDPDLQAQFVAAVGAGDTPEGVHVAFVVEAAMPNPSVIPAKIGRYEIRKLLGSGGMGVLYLAVDPELNRQVAVKLLRFNVGEMHERFRVEAQSLARLGHRNVVTIFDIGEQDGYPFMAMEYIAGETFEELIRRRPPMPVAQRVRLIADLCDGLACAHKSGVIHRDIKPSNVMLTQEGTLKIIDFGIARLVDSGITRTGEVIGTLHYMSPEQLERRGVDHRSDMFSVGLVMYELLTWHRAFPGKVEHVVARHIVSDEPQPLIEIIPEIDPDLVQIVTRALRKQPEDRYPDLTAMRAALMSVATRSESVSPGKNVIGEDRRGTPTARWESATHWRLLRQPAFAAACVGGIVIAITVAVTLSREPAVGQMLPSAQTTESTAAGAPPLTQVVDAVPRVAPEAGAQPVSTGSLGAPVRTDVFDQRSTTSAAASPEPLASRPPPPTAPSPNLRPVAAGGETSSANGDRIAKLMKEAERLRLQREYDAAIAQYQEVLELFPEDEKARAGLRETLEAKERADEAFERLAGLSPRSWPDAPSVEAEAQRLIDVAMKAWAANDEVGAERALADVLRINPRNESAQKLLKALTGR